MKYHPRQLMLKGTVRRFCALAFLMFLLVEWGTHDVAFAQLTSSQANAAQAEQGQHEDVCRTLIRCSNNNRRQELPVPNFGHVGQHNAVFDYFSDADLKFYLREDPRIQRSRVDELSRPPTPPFHPPQLS